MDTKVLIATLCKNTITSQCAFSLVNMVNKTDIPVSYAMQMGADIPGGRTILINKAIEQGFSHILFVDEDMAFGSDSLDRLMAHNKDIVGADYNFREFPLKGMADKMDEGELVRCKSMPTGFMLIRLSIFEKIEKPWFAFEWDNNGELKNSEDVYFCHKAREVGFNIYCDTTLQVKHVGLYNY